MMNLLTFQNSDFNSWTFIVQLGIVSLVLLIANIVRRRVKIFRTLLFPTAIIGGFIGLLLKYIIIWLNITIDGNLVLQNSFLEGITYHAIAIGFIAMGLKSVKKKDSDEIKGRPVKTGLLIVNTYLLQGIIGVSLSIILAYMFNSVAAYSGLLLPMGFGQGPGQASNIGGVFEDAGFIGGKTFGLSIATIGTLWSSVAGIYYINKQSRRGNVSRAKEETSKLVTSEVVESESEIPLSEAIDKMSIQVIFVVIVYFISYLIMKGITTLVNVDAVTGLIWGFNFIFGMLVAILFRTSLSFLRKKGLVKRKYTNEYMLNRITGTVFDYMIVASIMSINVNVLNNTGLWISLLLITTIGGLITYFYLRYTIHKIYIDYPHEAFAALFGNLTGTASNGIALLREIDPNFETPAADDLVTGSSTAVMFGAPILVITALISNPKWYFLWGSLLAMIIIFIIFSIFLYREKKEIE